MVSKKRAPAQGLEEYAKERCEAAMRIATANWKIDPAKQYACNQKKECPGYDYTYMRGARVSGSVIERNLDDLLCHVNGCGRHFCSIQCRDAHVTNSHATEEMVAAMLEQMAINGGIKEPTIEREYVCNGKANVYKAQGEEYDKLRELAIRQVFNYEYMMDLEQSGRTLNILVVEQMDAEYCNYNSGMKYPDLEDIKDYYVLELPCIIFAPRELMVELSENDGLKRCLYTAPVFKSEYIWLYAADDVELPPGHATIFGKSWEAVADMSVRACTSKSDSRVPIDLDASKLPLLRDFGGGFKPIVDEGDLGAPPPKNMYPVGDRFAMNNWARGYDDYVGPHTSITGEPNFQQGASTTSIVSRLCPHLRRIFEKAMMGQAARKVGCRAIVNDGFVLDSAVCTVGGWGNVPHFDKTDGTGMAFITLFAIGDTTEVRGGWLALPGLAVMAAPKACLMQAVRTPIIAHFTFPHTATNKGRLVGSSLHNNKELEKAFNYTPEGSAKRQNKRGVPKQLANFNYLHHVQEGCVDQATLTKYPYIKKLKDEIPLESNDWL